MNKTMCFFLGVLFAAVMLFLMGAAANQGLVGKYQIAAMDSDDSESGLFIVDTTSGIVKPVMIENGPDQLGIPFEEMEPESEEDLDIP